MSGSGKKKRLSEGASDSVKPVASLTFSVSTVTKFEDECTSVGGVYIYPMDLWSRQS
jgi:hypothetical protein